MANVKGGLRRKRIKMFRDHEVQMAKITLGTKETAPTGGVLGGGGTSAVPVECTSADHNFLEFYLRANPATGSGNGLFIEMEAKKNLALYNRTIYTTVVVPSAANPRNPHAIKALLKYTDETSYCQGGSSAVTGDVEVPNKTMHASMGEIQAGIFQFVLGGTSFDFGADSSKNEASVLHVKVVGGDATSQGKLKAIMKFTGLAVGNKAAKLAFCNADVAGGGGASAGGIQVRVNGTNYWLPIYTL